MPECSPIRIESQRAVHGTAENRLKWGERLGEAARAATALNALGESRVESWVETWVE